MLLYFTLQPVVNEFQLLPTLVNEEKFPVSRVLKRIAKNLSFFSSFLFQVCHLPLKSNHILVDSEGGGKWAPSMRKSQRSQSLQILRTQARARRERGADPCVALGCSLDEQLRVLQAPSGEQGSRCPRATHGSAPLSLLALAWVLRICKD